MENNGLSRGTKIFIVLLFFFLGALIVILLYPVTAVSSPTFFQLQQNVRYISQILGPYLAVGLLGGIVGVAELASTFQTYPREALLTRWAWVLIIVNIVAAMFALLIVRATMTEMNVTLQILTVGVGFQAVIRTKFVLAKQVGGSGNSEVSVNLGWLYDQFQNMARTQIDLELMNRRRTAVTRLTTYYSTLAELYDVAYYTITARATLTPAEEKAKLEEIEKLLEPNAPEYYAKSSLALMILENGGGAYVELLLDQAMHPLESATIEAAPTGEQTVQSLLSSYTLDELVALTKDRANNERVIEYVEKAAQPDSNANPETQKATIAQFMVQNIGADLLQEH